MPIRYDSFFTYCISASVLLQVTFLPILGALADYSHLRKRLMQLFCVLGAVATILMFFIQPGGHWFGGLLFLLANLAFGASIVFYNSYLPNIASEDQRDRVSSFGWAMGYLGGGLLLLLNLVLYLFAGQDRAGLRPGGAHQPGIGRASGGWVSRSSPSPRLRSRHAARPLPAGRALLLTIGFKQLAQPDERADQAGHGPDAAAAGDPGAASCLGLPIWLALLPGARADRRDGDLYRPQSRARCPRR